MGLGMLLQDAALLGKLLQLLKDLLVRRHNLRVLVQVLLE